jgi:hypothetical protein
LDIGLEVGERVERNSAQEADCAAKYADVDSQIPERRERQIPVCGVVNSAIYEQQGARIHFN